MLLFTPSNTRPLSGKSNPGSPTRCSSPGDATPLPLADPCPPPVHAGAAKYPGSCIEWGTPGKTFRIEASY